MTIRLAAIAQKPPGRPRQFGPFTNPISAAALIGAYVGMASILVSKF